MKRSIRTMMEMDKFDFVKPFHEYLNILSCNDNMKKLLQGRFMQKVVNYSEAINNHQKKLVISCYQRALSKRSLAYTGYKLWNQEVPIDIKSVKTIKAFNKAYRKHLMSNINA